jgi:putative NADPH-quinone reductase
VNKIDSILIVLANTPRNKTHRDGLLHNLYNTYVAECKKQNIKVSTIDLSKEINHITGKNFKKEKIEEYQIKIKNANMVTFFHPVIWSLPSNDIKAFVDKVFVPGFAYTTLKGIAYGQMEGKKLEVFATTDSPKWHEMFVSNNAISYFWNRILSDKCGFDTSKLHLISNYRSISDKHIEKWHKTVSKSVEKLNNNNSILDLF